MKKILLLILLSTFGFNALSQKISEMTPATSLAGAELFPIVQSGANKRATISQIPFTDSVRVSNDSLYHRKLGTWRFVYKLSSGGGSGISELTGPVTASGSGSVATTITNSAVTNAKLANMAANTIKGNNTGGGNVPVDLTASQVKALLSLDNVNNTSDANKPVSAAQQTALDGKAATSHTHIIANVTGLQTAIDGKAAASHVHAGSDITSGTISTARMGSGTANSTTVLYGDNVWRAAGGGISVDSVNKLILRSKNATALSPFTWKNRGEKIRGVTVAPDYARHNAAWEVMWMDGEWQNDTAAGWLVTKKQIDLAHGLGANAIHMKGSYGTFEQYGICSGTNPTPFWHWDVDHFLRNQKKVIEYAASLGMYYYLGLSGVEAYLSVGIPDYCSPTYAQRLVQDSIVVTELEKYKGVVIGIDYLNESALWLDDARGELNLVDTAEFLSVLRTKYAYLKKLTTIPLTTSINHRGGGTQDRTLFTNQFIGWVEPICDFFDFHPYYSGGETPVQSDLEPLLALYDKKIWYGEYGGFMADADMRTKNATGVRDLMERPESEACFMFEVKSHGPAGGYEDYGMFDADDNPRMDVVGPFMTTRQRSETPYVMKVDLDADYLVTTYDSVANFVIKLRNDRPIRVVCEYSLDIKAGPGNTFQVATWTDGVFSGPFGVVEGGRRHVNMKSEYTFAPGYHTYRPVVGVVTGTATEEDVMYASGASSIIITYYPLN